VQRKRRSQLNRASARRSYKARSSVLTVICFHFRPVVVLVFLKLNICPYSVIVVKDPATKVKIAESSYEKTKTHATESTFLACSCPIQNSSKYLMSCRRTNEIHIAHIQNITYIRPGAALRAAERETSEGPCRMGLRARSEHSYIVPVSLNHEKVRRERAPEQRPYCRSNVVQGKVTVKR
jgi:hypothetical protein